MKKFSIPCDFNGVKSPFTVYIGDPEPSHHPLNFQADWLSKERGGTIPQEVMDSVAKLKELADKNNVSFEELCVYALGAAQQSEQEDLDDELDDSEDNEDMDDLYSESGDLQEDQSQEYEEDLAEDFDEEGEQLDDVDPENLEKKSDSSNTS